MYDRPYAIEGRCLNIHKVLISVTEAVNNEVMT